MLHISQVYGRQLAIKSMKKHLRKVGGEVKPVFEELTTIVSQIEACLNSRPPVLVPLANDDEGIEVLPKPLFLVKLT